MAFISMLIKITTEKRLTAKWLLTQIFNVFLLPSILPSLPLSFHFSRKRSKVFIIWPICQGFLTWLHDNEKKKYLKKWGRIFNKHDDVYKCNFILEISARKSRKCFLYFVKNTSPQLFFFFRLAIPRDLRKMRG